MVHDGSYEQFDKQLMDDFQKASSDCKELYNISFKLERKKTVYLSGCQ